MSDERLINLLEKARAVIEGSIADSIERYTGRIFLTGDAAKLSDEEKRAYFRRTVTPHASALADEIAAVIDEAHTLSEGIETPTQAPVLPCDGA